MSLSSNIHRSFIRCGLIGGVLFFANQAAALQSKILVLGDSLTAGYRLSKDQAYSSLLTQEFQKDGYDMEFVNAGVSGDTSAQALRRVEWSLKKLGPFKAAIVWIGYNDALRQLPPEQLQKNLDQTLSQLKAAGLPVYLLGVKIPLNFMSSYRTAFEKVHPSLAKKYKLPFDPFPLQVVALQSDLNLDDGIHPNANGHKKLQEHLSTFLRANGILKLLKN